MNIGIDLDDTLIDRENNVLKEFVSLCLPLLYEKGFLFHLITARHNKDKVDKIVKCIEKGLKIKFTSVTLTYQNSKGSYAKDKNCMFMIDDNPTYISDCVSSDVIPILFSDRNSNNKKWITCKTWIDIYYCLLSFNNNKSLYDIWKTNDNWDDIYYLMK